MQPEPLFIPEIWSKAILDKMDQEIMDMHHGPEKFLPEEIRHLILLSGVGISYIGGEGAEWHIMFGHDARFIETHIPAESTIDTWREAIGSTIDKWNEIKNEQTLPGL